MELDQSCSEESPFLFLMDSKKITHPRVIFDIYR